MTATAVNRGVEIEEDVALYVALPPGVAYRSDDGEGSLDLSTGLWSAGTVAPGESRRLTVTAAVEDELFDDVVVALASPRPGDVLPANDEAATLVHAGGSSVRVDVVDDDGDGMPSGDDVPWDEPIMGTLEHPATEVEWEMTGDQPGTLLFDGLPAGDFRLRVELPAGALVAVGGGEATVGDDGTIAFRLGRGEQRTIDLPLWRDVDLKVAILGPRALGADVELTVRVENAGSHPAHDVRVTPAAPLPPGLHWDRWMIDALGPGHGVERTMRGRLVEAGLVVMKAEARERDLDESDNEAQLTVRPPQGVYFIHGTVCDDEDGDGHQGRSEGLLLDRLTIRLSRGAPAMETELYQGGYRFTGLQAGVAYTVEVVNMPGAKPLGTDEALLTEGQPTRIVDFCVPRREPAP